MFATSVKWSVLLGCITTVLASSVDVNNGRSLSILGKLQAGQMQAGETLSALARRYHVGYDEVVAANPHIDIHHMQAGDTLIIPSKHLLLAKPREGIVVNLPERRLYHYDAKQQVSTYPVGVGEIGWSTPLGVMTIIGKRKNPTWYVPNSVWLKNAEEGVTLPRVVQPGPDNPLGTRAMRLSQPSYLIHGTNAPSGIGKRSTAGCISLYPEDVVRLYNNTPIETKVTVVDEDLKWAVIHHKLCVEVHAPLQHAGDGVKEREAKRVVQQKKLMALASNYPIRASDAAYWSHIQHETLGVPQCVWLDNTGEPSAGTD
jgi:L,D-transpeptidase ErfK/SrfK